MLAPLSTFAFIDGAWLVLEWNFKSSEFARVGFKAQDGLGEEKKNGEGAARRDAVVF